MAFESLQQAVIPRFEYPGARVKVEGPLPCMGRVKSRTAKYTSVFLARNRPGVLFFACGYNNAGAIRYIQIHDLDTDVIAAGATPDIIIPVNAGQGWSFDAGASGLPLAYGIVIACSSVINTYDSTGMGNDQWMMCVHNELI